MKHSIRIAFAAFVVAAQLPALASEIAVLKNGFSIRCEPREQNGDTMRLYTAGGHVDIPASEIASSETDETPITPAPTSATAAPSVVTAMVKSATPSAAQLRQVGRLKALPISPSVSRLREQQSR